ncbi:TetR/AcrR family transcriptional regulator [Georgenia wangjunii]|uniref:TetR/AcrR family transcriptional regulator n=1 Tax=Georgenia wangjunii TaxID=3117730 RepID=UPI002F263DDF
MPRPRLYDETLRRRLVECAARAISADGAGAVSLRTVAASAGTTTAAVYTLFGSREGLLNAVVEEGFEGLAGHLTAVPPTDDPAADLLSLGLAYRESALADPHYYRVMFGAVGACRETPGPGTAHGRTASVDGARPGHLGRPTFVVLRDAAARVLGDGDASRAGGGAPDAPGASGDAPETGGAATGADVPSSTAAAEHLALRLWALAHGLVSLELAGLLPGDRAERTRRYVTTLRAERP